MSKPRVIIADDHHVFRLGLKQLLEDNEVEVVAEASNGEELLDLVTEQDCDIVITDLSMPKMNGLEAIRLIRARKPSVKIMVLSMHKDRNYIRKILAEEVEGYILKDDVFEEITRAIRLMMHGKKAYSGDLLDSVTEEYNAMQDAQVRLEVLTRREKEVLTLLASGLTNKEMAQQLGISPRTVETHRQHLMEKLDFENVQEAVRFAVEMNLV